MTGLGLAIDRDDGKDCSTYCSTEERMAIGFGVPSSLCNHLLQTLIEYILERSCRLRKQVGTCGRHAFHRVVLWPLFRSPTHRHVAIPRIIAFSIATRTQSGNCTYFEIQRWLSSYSRNTIGKLARIGIGLLTGQGEESLCTDHMAIGRNASSRADAATRCGERIDGAQHTTRRLKSGN